MNSYDSSELTSAYHWLAEQIMSALCAGQAEEPEKETELILRYLARCAPKDPDALDSVLGELAKGVSPYHIIGEYQMPGTNCTIIVPRNVMPPGSVTSDTILAIQEITRLRQPLHIADIGCGTGVLGISALLINHQAKGLLVDVDPAACAASNANLVRIGLTHRTAVLCGDGLPQTLTGSFDLLVANLPFVATSDIQDLPPRFSRYVPRVAVNGGQDGLDLIRGVLPQIKNALQPTGCVILQVGTGQKGSVVCLMGKGWDFGLGSMKSHPNLVIAARIP